MKNTGKKFEDLVVKSAKEQQWDITRFRDAGYTGFKDSGGNKRFTIKNICDFVMFKAGHIFYIECKSSKQRLEIKRLTQHEALKKKHSEGVKNVHAGYLLEIDSAYFYVPVFEMDLMISATEKKSFNKSDFSEFWIDTFLPPRKKKPRIGLDFMPIHKHYG